MADWKKETVAGVTTFFTMAYIVVVNPMILSTAGTGLTFSGTLTATVLLAFSMSLLMGLYAKLPFAVAPGMGINAFFAYGLILGRGIAWPVALGLVFWAGVLFALISFTPLRERIARAIPLNIRVGAAGGIGAFLALIGLKQAGLVVGDPVTLVKLGKLGTESLLALGGLIVTSELLRRKNPFAFLVGIGSVTLGAALLGKIAAPEQWVALPDFHSVLFKLDIWGALQLSLVPAILAVCFTDLFDSISTFVGVSHATGLVDKKGEPLRLREGLIVDAWATLTAGLVGTSSGTAFIESAAGIEAGGRTGRTAIVTALCFLPCFFLAPVAALVPSYATAPVLLIVGALMFRSLKALEVDKIEDLIPGALTVLLIPFTFSITQGILWGLVSHSALYFLAGRRKEISPLLAGLSILCLILLAIENGA
ncbi:NCS2 family permease [bacterium]|nr:NCS2 family permease [bacterium]